MRRSPSRALGSYLSLPWAGEVDLLIRTGGEQRVSNFLLWQSTYAEMWFNDVLWPDFSAKDLQMHSIGMQVVNDDLAERGIRLSLSFSVVKQKVEFQPGQPIELNR